MKRFMLLTFAFLGASLYYLSGGADFEPRGTRADNAANATQPVQSVLAESAPKLGTSQPGVATSPAQAPASTDEGQEILANTRLDLKDSLSGLRKADGLEGLKLASLENGLIGLTPQEEAEPQPARSFPTFEKPLVDLRYITGNSVNVRQGPGTNFPVISRVVKGDEVEVLSDPGNGWLRLRTLPDEKMGWISASLVSAQDN